MKKIIFSVLGSVLLLSAVPVLAGPNINELTAQVAQQGGYETAGVTAYTLSESVGRIIRIALSLIGTIFLALTIYAGFLWMTASGNEEKVETATKILRSSVIGLVIIMAAYGLTAFVVAAITSSAGVGGAKVGGGAGEAGFWSSFGKNFWKGL